MYKIEGNIVDIYAREIYPAEIEINGPILSKITRNTKSYTNYITPGFIDSHVHIESSMLTPVAFSDLVIPYGTIAIINDPHEIANVLGVSGIEYMMESSRNASIKCFFGIPSCVPATPYDHAGYVINSEDIELLAKTKNFVTLSEMMNVPGVLNKDKEVWNKIQIAKKYNLPIDGHAPGLRGVDLKKYIQAGILTDHETVSLDEALEKIGAGMKIIIREGSAAKNYNELKALIKNHSDSLLFCTDDAHPDEIIRTGHINKLVIQALKDGFNLFDVYKIASKNPIEHYKLPVGMLREGDFADFICVENLETLDIKETYINGEKKYDRNQINSSVQLKTKEKSPNNFNRPEIQKEDLQNPVEDEILAIGVNEGQLWTDKRYFPVKKASNFESDTHRDILKIVYLNRYVEESVPRIAYIQGIGLKEGAFASSIAHDSHNIIAVGTSDEAITAVINEIIKNKGGLVVKNNVKMDSLPLPIAGIMSDKDAKFVAGEYENLNELLKQQGCKLESPFMTLAFMSLIVIPELKIGEKGLFDYSIFNFINQKNAGNAF